MSRNERQTKKGPRTLSGQLDLFGASDVVSPALNKAANQPAFKPANDAAPPVQVAFASAQMAAPPKPTKPSLAGANSNEPEKRPRGRPRKAPPLAGIAPVAPKALARDLHADGLRDEWWNSHMVCVFLKISRKTLWERRRAKGLNFPQPKLLGGARNLYRASAIREWAERIADAEF